MQMQTVFGKKYIWALIAQILFLIFEIWRDFIVNFLVMAN